MGWLAHGTRREGDGEKRRANKEMNLTDRAFC
jgi:hypothetical protein